MKVWAFTGFKGFNPIGTAAVVAACSMEGAIGLMNDALAKEGLPPLEGDEEIIQIGPNQAYILNNGDY